MPTEGGEGKMEMHTWHGEVNQQKAYDTCFSLRMLYKKFRISCMLQGIADRGTCKTVEGAAL